MDSFVGKKVAIYARVCTNSQAEGGLSISDQTMGCERFTVDQGGEVLRTYIEHGTSANTTSRPIFQKMLADARQGDFNVVVASSASRLFRNLLEYIEARAGLRSAGVQLVSATEHFEDRSAGTAQIPVPGFE